MSVQAEATGISKETAPNASTIIYHFPKRESFPPVKVVWYDGKRMPERPAELEPSRKMGDHFGGTLYVGNKGKIMTGGLGDGVRLIPETAMQAYKRPSTSLSRSSGHYQEFIDACKGGQPAGANFSYGGSLTEAVLLGNVALQTLGRRLDWDHDKMAVTNLPAANAFISSEDRIGW